MLFSYYQNEETALARLSSLPEALWPGKLRATFDPTNHSASLLLFIGRWHPPSSLGSDPKAWAALSSLLAALMTQAADHMA